MGQLWQGWAVGEFYVPQAGKFLVQIVDWDFTQTFTQSFFFIDNYPYNGNTVGYTWPWFAVTLSEGWHNMTVHVSGGGDSEDFTVSWKQWASELEIIQDDWFPDVVDGTLAAPYISFAVLNAGDDWIGNLTFGVTESNGVEVDFSILPYMNNLSIAPNQIMPLALSLNPQSQITSCPWNITITISNADNSIPTVSHMMSLPCKSFPEPYTFTFPDFDGTVNWAAVLPPTQACSYPSGCSVLLSLHGAGVVANSQAWIGSYESQNYSYVLLPTNRRQYGFDWEGAGRLDGQTAFAYFVEQLPGVPKDYRTTYKADANRIIYAGHSMGGHGCWNIMTHFPDKALATVCAAGWISWPFYVLYAARAEETWIDPFLGGILRSAIAEHDADFYTPNAVGIPLMARMGENDTTVPPWHLRRMARLIDELSGSPDQVLISEIPNEGHWFNGVVDDAVIQAFFNTYANESLPALPNQLTITTMNPRTFGGRANILILQLSIPYRAGRINVQISDDIWILTTENIRRFGFYTLPGRNLPNQIVVDGNTLTTNLYPQNDYYRDSSSSSWKVEKGLDWQKQERSPQNYGPIRTIYENSVAIVVGSLGTANETALFLERATWLANDLYLTGHYSISIIFDSDYYNGPAESQNLILLGGPQVNSVAASLQSHFPPRFTPTGIVIGKETYEGPEIGYLFLSPWEDGRLIVLIGGNDEQGFKNAFTLFPLHAGAQIPDFIVTDPTFPWKGAGGYLAAGFWDNDWTFNSNIAYQRSLSSW